ncbi:HAMP domain-containing histidine kinase [bacterium]|nr:HAMP domain-containing histidine kinase [bacterium]
MKRLCSVLSHELNNDSGIIQGYVELLRMELGSNSESDYYLDRILQACGRLTDRSRSLESFAETRELMLLSCDLSPLLLEESERHPGVQLSLDDTIRPVAANPDTLRQAIRELLNNATEASPNLPVRVHYAPCGEGMQLVVSNRGECLDPELLDSIFDPYVSTRGKGRGLGLARVHGILSRHHAQFFVDKSPADEIQFHIHFPPAPPDPAW